MAPRHTVHPEHTRSLPSMAPRHTVHPVHPVHKKAQSVTGQKNINKGEHETFNC